MKYLSLFSGIGGFELGIQYAYEDYQSKIKGLQTERHSTDTPSDPLQRTPLCIGYSEIDKYAIQVYEKHFKHKNYGDCTKINPAELPDFDLLVGGFPCQAFSIAGKRRGFDDTRGTLFFDIARILKEKRPRNFILENVKGLLSHDNGRTFKTIIATLVELGYCVEWQVLNAKNFGVPQNRERVFIVGHFGGIPRRKVFPIREGNEIHNGKRNERVGKALTATNYKGVGNDGTTRIEDFYPDRIRTFEKVSPTIRQGREGLKVVRQPLRFLDRNQKNIEGDYAFTVDASQTSGIKIQNNEIQKTNTNKALRILWNQIGKEAFYEWAIRRLGSFQKEEVLQSDVYGREIQREADKEKSTMDDGTLSRQKLEAERELRGLWEDECKRCSSQRPRLAEQLARELAENMQELPQQTPPYRIRRLTPLEAERLMGYPDFWTAEGTQGKISDTQRYKMCGNGIVSYVVKEIVKRLL